MRRTLTAALSGALLLVCMPAFADVAPRPGETIEAAFFYAVAAGVLAVAGWLVYRARRRR